MASIKKIVDTWVKRSKRRNELKNLSDHTLKDIGLTKYDIVNEVRKPFWKE